MDDLIKARNLLGSIETNKSFNSLEEHKLRIKEKNLTYEDLLDHAALSSSWCELTDFENEQLKKLNEGLELVLEKQSKEFKKFRALHDDLMKISELSEFASSNANFLEGQIAGRDAQKKIMARKGATAKKASDPKQEEKQFVHVCWKNWQQTPISYASKAAFARDMLEKCEYLTSQKKIEDWCREWESKAGIQQAQ